MRDAELGTKVKATKADATLECEDCEECEEVTLELEGFHSSLGAGEGVKKFVLSFVAFLGLEGWTFFLGFRLSNSCMEFCPKVSFH